MKNNMIPIPQGQSGPIPIRYMSPEQLSVKVPTTVRRLTDIARADNNSDSSLQAGLLLGRNMGRVGETQVKLRHLVHKGMVLDLISLTGNEDLDKLKNAMETAQYIIMNANR